VFKKSKIADVRLVGPNGLTLRLRADEHFPDDPGNGTPAMVELPIRGERWPRTSTFWCAIGEGEVDGAELSIAQSRWLEEQHDVINKFLLAREAELREG
jgi:hypothetical protein